MEINGSEKLLIQNWRLLCDEQAEIMFNTIDALAFKERQRTATRKAAAFPGLRLVSSQPEPK